MKKDWRKTIIKPTATIREAVQTIDAGAIQIALVVDDDGKLQGTVTDGDVRRAMLRGVSFEEGVSKVMSTKPVVGRPHEARDDLIARMHQKSLHHLPIIDDDGRLVGFEVFDELVRPATRTNPVVLMAGGLGSRMGELTADRPKPLLPVGEKPLLETILSEIADHGFRSFYFAVNYKAEMIVDHFKDGAPWGVDIKYLHEKQKMGTAGALGLLLARPTEPVLVMNGDLLTKLNFAQLLDFHVERKAVATMCVREYDFQVPFGVVGLDQHRIVSIDEKPRQRFHVNAGIYVLSPEALDLVPPGEYFDMTQLFEKLIEKKMRTVAFPVREYWMDIGRAADFEKANDDFWRDRVK